MGSTVFPAAGGGATLPVGATEKIASGFVQNGYASISGTFPAGKYLVVSDSACNVNFTNAVDTNGYQNAIFSRGGSCVVNVPISTSVIEYNAMLAQEEYMYSTGILTTTGSVSPHQSTYAALTRRSKLNVDGMPLGGAYPAFPYKGKLISLSSTGVIWKSTDWENGINTGISAGFTPAGGATGMVGTDGTTWRGSSNGAAGMWSTTNPEASGWSTQTLPSNFTNVIYGNGIWLALASGGTTYAYSTNGTTWTTSSLPLNPPDYSPIAFGNGKFVLTGSSSYSATRTIAYSTDGINWTTVTVGMPDESASNRAIHGVAFGNGRFVVGWGATVATTDVRNSNTFVSVDGINWIPGSKCHTTTSTSNTHRFYPVFDGTGFNLINDRTGSLGYRTIDGLNTIPITGFTAGWGTSLSNGTRGNYVNASSERLNTTKFNTTFSIYKLDPSYTTY